MARDGVPDGRAARHCAAEHQPQCVPSPDRVGIATVRGRFRNAARNAGRPVPRPRARFDTLAGALRGLLFALLTAIVSSTAFAQVAVPAVSRQPLRIILPANAGSGMDLTARTIREALSVALGDRPVIVENRPGAAGLVAIQVLRAAHPDGAKIGLLSNSYLLNRSGPQSMPNERANDELTPSSIVAVPPLGCVALRLFFLLLGGLGLGGLLRRLLGGLVRGRGRRRGRRFALTDALRGMLTVAR